MDRVDSPKRYPADKVGSAQADGQIWSAALWDLFRTTNDRGATDTIVLQSHFLVPPANPTFADGVQALLDADELLYASLHKAQICAVAAARGLPAAGCEFTATVTWDNPLVDLDLHLRPPDGVGYVGWDYVNDCYSQNPNPDWGAAGDASDDPLLKLDCRYTSGTGCHEEQIALTKFGASGAYEVLVHYFQHSGWLDEPTTATVNVYQGGRAALQRDEAAQHHDRQPPGHRRPLEGLHAADCAVGPGRGDEARSPPAPLCQRGDLFHRRSGTAPPIARGDDGSPPFRKGGRGDCRTGIHLFPAHLRAVVWAEGAGAEARSPPAPLCQRGDARVRPLARGG